MTELEKYNAWKEANPHAKLRVSWNPQGVATEFGGTVRRRTFDDMSLVFYDDEHPSYATHYVDFGGNVPTTEQLEEYFAKQMNIIISSLSDGVPSIFYDSHDPISRLESLARVFDQAAREGKTRVSVGNPEQVARDIDFVLGELGHRVHYDQEIDIF